MSDGTAVSSLVATKSTTLDSISDECIDLITRHLDYFDVRALELCGNRALSARIERGVSQVRALVPSLGKWPLHAFNYRNMRSLTVINAGAECNMKLTTPVIAEEDRLIPKTGHKLLESLKIQTILCFTVARLQSPSLEELLPNLRSLDLEGEGAFDPKSFFKMLPSKLTFLRLKASGNSVHVNRNMPPALIADLPRSLETLLLQDCDIQFDKDPFAADAVISFPPALTRLRVTSNYILPAVQAIPKSVTDLTLGMSYLGTRQELSVSSLCSLNLKRFQFKCGSAYNKVILVLDRPFPTTLHTLIFPHEFQSIVDGDTVTKEPELDRYLPPSLTSFGGLSLQHTCINWGTTLPNMKHGRIYKTVFKTQPPTKFPPLLSLNIPELDLPDASVQAFPTTLIQLRASVRNTPVWMEKMKSLTSLSELQLNESSIKLPSIGFWDLMRERLTSLDCVTAHFESLDDLCCDWKRLESLALHCYASEEFGPKDLEKYTVDPTKTNLKLFRLPPALKRLHFVTMSHFDFFAHSLAYLTQLEALSIGIEHAEHTPQDHNHVWSILETLPKSITHFSIDTPTPLPAEYLKYLPKTIVDLSLRSSASYKEPVLWSEEHFRLLPPKLAFIFAQSAKEEYDNFKDALPPTLSLGITYGNVLPDLTPAMKELARQKNLP